MRIWDIDPGYLNCQSLIVEHRELHALVSIVVNGKQGCTKHRETIRWLRYGWALKFRHKQLLCEMQLRGYVDGSPVRTRSNSGCWPTGFIVTPAQQFKLLKDQYPGREKGRIELPSNEEQLWRQHKYSVLARDPCMYKSIGQNVARKEISMAALSELLVKILRTPPSEGGIRNAVQHMWGYVSNDPTVKNRKVTAWSTTRLLMETQKRAIEQGEPYIRNSTALSELMVWL